MPLKLIPGEEGYGMELYNFKEYTLSSEEKERTIEVTIRVSYTFSEAFFILPNNLTTCGISKIIISQHERYYDPMYCYMEKGKRDSSLRSFPLDVMLLFKDVKSLITYKLKNG